MVNIKEDTDNNPYQQYLAEKHGCFETPAKIVDEMVKKATGSVSIEKKRLIEGKINEVYDIVTEDKQSVIVRISRREESRFEAEEKAIRLVLMAGVPAPRVLLIDHAKSSNKKLTFCVEEKIEGEALKLLMGTLESKNLRSIISEAGSILSKIHSVPLKGFGGLYREEPYKSWAGYILEVLDRKKRVIEASKTIGVAEDLVQNAMEILEKHVKLYEKVEPKLLHGDFSAEHLLIKNNHVVGIIDFENSMGGDPVYDFAWFNYFHGQQIPTKWLKDGYTEKSIFDNNFNLKMKLYRLHLGLRFIDYYEREGNKAGINYAKDSFTRELENLQS